MKYVIDGATGKTTPYNGSMEESPIHETMSRALEELEGWEMYKNMNDPTGGNRYTHIAHQEFQHMLVAMSDFVHCLKSQATTEELTELHNWLKQVHVQG